MKFKTEQLANIKHVADRNDAYITPEGDHVWAIIEAEGEESLGRDLLEGQEAEELRSVLLAREYVAIQRAREDLENSKARFIDDPSGTLAEARGSVGKALEARGYPPERTNEAPRSRREILREYQDADTGDAGSLEDMRSAFDRLSDLLLHPAFGLGEGRNGSLARAARVGRFVPP